MKKTLLTLVAACFVTASAFAQTPSSRVSATPSQTACSGNIVTAGEDGYAFNFNSSENNNCFANGGVQFDAAVTNQSWAIDGIGNLVVTVPVMTAYNDSRQRSRFYKDGCTAQIVDLSGAGSKKISLKVTSDATANRQLVVVFYSLAESNYSAAGLNIFTVAPGVNTFTDEVVDLTGITDASNITSIGLFFRGAGLTPWNDFDAAGTYTIDYIYVGTADASTAPTPPTDCGTTTANHNANVVNDQVNVFPNPAKGAFTVDMTAMNNSETAFVKVLNANGNIVKEFTSNLATPSVVTDGLVKGIYMVQVTSGNKIATKKVVVE